jgi:hypothetical protein
VAATVAYKLAGDVGWAAGTGIFVLGVYLLLFVLEGGRSFRSNAILGRRKSFPTCGAKERPGCLGRRGQVTCECGKRVANILRWA